MPNQGVKTVAADRASHPKRSVAKINGGHKLGPDLRATN